METVELVIVGLGNPGVEYAGTRHNTGFIIVDALYDELRSGRNQAVTLQSWFRKYQSRYCEGTCVTSAGKTRFGLLKPDTFMNRSGIAVTAAWKALKLSPARLLVIHDDVDLDTGDIRFRQGGSDGGHNGVENIVSCLNRNDIYRLRVGAGPRRKNFDLSDHVLARFTAEEERRLAAVIPGIVTMLRHCLEHGLLRTQTIYKRLLAHPADCHHD